MARPYRLIFLTFALAMPLAGQAHGPENQEPPSAVVEGSVINTQNSRSIPRASVTLVGTKGVGSKSARADGNGHFVFTAVEAGIYRLAAERQGFFSDERRREYQPVVEVASGQHLKNVAVRLMPTAVVAGEIRDEYSDPIQNVRVKLLAHQVRLGRMYLRPAGTAVTNDLGEYRISGLRPGRYYLVAEYQNKTINDNRTGNATAGLIEQARTARSGNSAKVEVAEDPDPPFTYPPLFYPATGDFQQAQSLALQPGDEIAANFLLVSAPLVSIRGRITNGMTGAPAGTASVSASWTEYVEGVSLPGKVSPQDGTFEIKGLAPGIYTIHAAFTEDKQNYAGEQTIEVGHYGAQNVQIAALPDFAAAGHVSIQAVTAQGTSQPMDRVLVEFVGEGLTPAVNVRATAPELKFMAQLRPEKRYYTAVRNLPDDYYLKSLSIYGHEVPPDNVVVSGLGGELELVLSPSGGHIEGVLFNSQDQPVRGSILLVPDVPDPGPPELFRRVRTDAVGKFALRGIVPGSYRLMALESLDIERDIQTPEFLRTLGNRGQHMQIDENGKYTMMLRLGSAADQ